MTDSHSDPPSSTDDEPETPVWLPALGFALFVVGGVAWAVTPPLASAMPPPLPAPSVVAASPPPPPTAIAPTASAPAASAPAAPLPVPPRPGGPPPKGKLPGATDAPGMMLPRPAKKHP